MLNKVSSKLDLARIQEQRAMNKYNLCFNNSVYSKAVVGKSSKYANKLIDEALCICGHPYYKMSNRNWNKEALSFLQLFVN